MVFEELNERVDEEKFELKWQSRKQQRRVDQVKASNQDQEIFDEDSRSSLFQLGDNDAGENGGSCYFGNLLLLG